MPVQTPVLNAAVDGAVALLGFASLHTADPGGTGANEVTGGGYARQPVTWDPATGGIRAASGVLAFTGPPNSPATHLGVWSAVSGGIFRGSDALTGDQTFNAAGEYDVTALTLTAANAP